MLVRVILKYCEINLFKTTKRIYRSSISFWRFKKIFSPWIQPLIRIFPWSSSTSSTGWGISQLSVRTFWVFLLHVSVKCGIWQICFFTIFTFKISALVIVLRSTFPDRPGSIWVVNITKVFIWIINILTVITHMHWVLMLLIHFFTFLILLTIFIDAINAIKIFLNEIELTRV